MTDYTKKIQNLLDLAKSPNEHEARSALLKARELMAKYKIAEKDLKNDMDQEIIRRMSGIDYSVRRDPWIPHLASVIATHHCCGTFQAREKGHQVAEIGIIGFSEDTDICMKVFIYAVECVRSVTNKLRKTKDVSVADGYGYGFSVGLSEAYHKQQNEEGWGLVMVVPEAVNEEINTMRKSPVRNHEDKIKNANGLAFTKGLRDGRKFQEQKRITEGE